MVVARHAGGWVEERKVGERSVLPRRAPRVTVAVQVRTLTRVTGNRVGRAPLSAWKLRMLLCLNSTISAQLGVKSLVFTGGQAAFANTRAAHLTRVLTCSGQRPRVSFTLKRVVSHRLFRICGASWSFAWSETHQFEGRWRCIPRATDIVTRHTSL